MLLHSCLQDVIEKIKAQYDGQSFSNIKLPLLDAAIFGQFEGIEFHHQVRLE